MDVHHTVVVEFVTILTYTIVENKIIWAIIDMHIYVGCSLVYLITLKFYIFDFH